MSPRETWMGGPKGRFPTTMWSKIIACTDEEEANRGRALEHLSKAYWRPVYRYIRFQGHNIEAAKDLTQDFICHLMEGDLLDRYEKEKGRFRAFLKGAVKIHLARHRSKKAALKRGGGLQILPLDIQKLESEPSGLSSVENPEDAFDRQWIADVLTRSVETVRAEFASRGKETHFKIYEAHRLQSEHESQVTYDQLAEEFGVSPHQVKHYLTVVRDRIHKQIRKTVSEGVTTTSELAAEMSELFHA